MASSLLLRLTKSVRPAVFASRLLTIHGGHPSVNITQRRPYSVPSVDQAWLKSQMALLPGVHSALFTKVESKHIVLQIPGLEKTKTDGGLCVTLNMPGVLKENVNARVDGRYLLIQAKLSYEESYLAAMELPANFNKSGDLNGDMKDGTLKLTLPMNVNKNGDIKDGMSKLTLPDVLSWMADFSSTNYNHLSQLVIFVMALRKNGETLLTQFSKAIEHRKETSRPRPWALHVNSMAEKIYMKVSYELVKTVSTNEGMCVSLNMPGFKIEDVKSCFEKDMLVIIGIRKPSELYLSVIHVPEGHVKNNNHIMIKTEMNDGIYKATVLNVSKEMEERERKKTNGEFYIN